jgi:hypothetical protein
MPIRDTAAMNASLDNDYGATHGPNAPASHDLALFDGDPMVIDDETGLPVGVELTGVDSPGYARVTIAAADWEPAADGAKALTAPVQMPDATDAWTEATHWGLFDGSTLWDCGPLTEALEVTEAGTGPLVSPVVFYDESVEAPA